MIFPTRMKSLLCVSFLLLLSQAFSRLVIHGPQELKEKFASSNSRIKASYANFGTIPYGQSMIGRIYYNATNSKGCSRTNITNDFSGDPDGILTPIFLVDRGECTFVTKVRNIEKAGGSLAVIIDDTGAENIHDIIMSDDGTGSGIRIPSMIISKKDGQLLKDFLLRGEKELTYKASLSAEFVVNNPTNRVHWNLWYTSSNDRGLDFIKYFKEEMD